MSTGEFGLVLTDFVGVSLISKVLAFFLPIKTLKRFVKSSDTQIGFESLSNIKRIKYLKQFNLVDTQLVLFFKSIHYKI